jgi:hypothetical protein
MLTLSDIPSEPVEGWERPDRRPSKRKKIFVSLPAPDRVTHHRSRSRKPKVREWIQRITSGREITGGEREHTSVIDDLPELGDGFVSGALTQMRQPPEVSGP